MDAPVREVRMDRSGNGWVCQDYKGNALPDFAGVAYCDEMGLYVSTVPGPPHRSFRTLGSESLAGALEEHEVLQKQMSLDL